MLVRPTGGRRPHRPSVYDWLALATPVATELIRLTIELLRHAHHAT
jgi:hypothetical protein